MKDLIIELKKKFHPAQIIVLIFLVGFGVAIGSYPRKILAAPIQITYNVGNPGPITAAAADGNDIIIDGAGYVDPTPGTNPSDDYFTVTTSGHHDFNSLTIKNNGTLTHDALIPGTDFVPANSNLIGPGLNKKVDLNITGDLVLDSNGSINVDGKGYPGSYPNIPYVKGYGPGGSDYSYINNYEHAASGGASYNGKGGPGTYIDPFSGNQITKLAGITYSDITYGSGAGLAKGAASGVGCNSAGGNGGGIIKIVTNAIKFNSTFSLISANGKAGVYIGSSGCESSAGGGSGGTVWLEVKSTIDYLNPSSPMWIARKVGVNINELGATADPTHGNYPNPANIVDGNVTVTLPGYGSASIYNINSMGGMASLQTAPGTNRGEAIGGVGGGGVIIIAPPAVPPVVPVSKAVTVKVEWQEGARTEKVELKTFLKH